MFLSIIVKRFAFNPDPSLAFYVFPVTKLLRWDPDNINVNQLNLNDMNRFTLQDLLIDAMTYGPALKYQFQSVKSYQDARMDMVHFLVENLIGSTEYQLLSDYPYACVRFIPADQDTTLILSLS